MNINEIGAKAGHCCEYEAPMPMDSRTIKDNIRETTEQLHIIEGMVDSLSRMLWAKDAVNEKTSIDIIDMDSNIVHNLDTARQIHNKMERIIRGLAKAFLNFTFGAPRASLGVKQVIFSGPKTIVFWLDGTKTIVSCGEGDHNDPYAGFCAAITKRVFGSTSQAKKVLARTRKETSK